MEIVSREKELERNTEDRDREIELELGEAKRAERIIKKGKRELEWKKRREGDKKVTKNIVSPGIEKIRNLFEKEKGVKIVKSGHRWPMLCI